MDKEVKNDSGREEHSVRTGRGRGSLTVPGTDCRAGKMEQMTGQGEEDGQRPG